MTTQNFTFQAEVSRLLDLVAHSLYSHKEIFLRELISNASDACDRLRYAALTEPELMAGDAELRITLSSDAKAKTLTIADNGIGMSRDELVENLGTIARSGTQAFVDKLGQDKKADVSLIGQFGVGFYAAFMVAGKVEVLSRKAGSNESWLWTSDGKGSFTVDEAKRDGRGTTITLHLKEGEEEFLEKIRLSTVVKTYSDHIAVPIVFSEGAQEEKLNEASALWTRRPADITAEQYKEFYHHAAHAFDEPWMTLHNKVEGVLSYTSLLFIPTFPPFDLFDPARKQHVKLYVKRVFITDDCKGLLPDYLRFLRGVVDCEDLPLNVSREMLQHEPRLARIRSGLVKRVLGELKKKAEKEPDAYNAFWKNFGAVLKEGLYEDGENRDALLGLARFASTSQEGLTDLEGYVARMRPGQEAIYTISGQDLEALRRSPQLEGYKKRGVEVLLLTDSIDEFWVNTVPTFKDKPFRSVTRGGADLDKIQDESAKDKPAEEKATDTSAVTELATKLKAALGDAVKDVRPSQRLTESAVCLVAAEGDMDINLERLLKQHGNLKDGPMLARILEINPDHELIRRLADSAKAGGDGIEDAAHLLLDQARIMEGEPVADPQAFARRLSKVMEKGLG
jgi:molecular chaperone HtpG